LGVELVERRLDVSNSAARARDADPQQQRDDRRQLRNPGNTIAGQVDLSDVAVDTAAKDPSVDKDQS
jgi:hypothetical protein